MKKQIRHLLVITSYPVKGSIHGPTTVGVASYAKHTLLSLVRATRRNRTPLAITVLAEQFGKKPASAYREDGIEVKRLWQRDDARSLGALFMRALRHPATDVLIECEVAMFGSPWTAVMFPLLTFALRLVGKQVTVVCHQVIRDINQLSGHIDVAPSTVQTDLLNVAIRFFYFLLRSSANHIVVFEEALKNFLAPDDGTSNVVVIPHGVPSVTSRLSKRTARKRLKLTGTFTILVFGFLAWYKGTDWMAKAILSMKGKKAKRIRLILAGGPNPNHMDKGYYRKYIESVQRLAAASHGRITISGFVPERMISTYFTAADLVVLPYRACMSASGPLAIAHAFGKPVILSQAMADMFATEDMKRFMESCGIMKEEIVFPLTYEGVTGSIRQFMRNRILRTKLTRLSQDVGDARDFGSIGKEYYKVLFEYESVESVGKRILSTVRTFWPYASQPMAASSPR